MGAFGGLLDRAAWPYIWIGAYLAGGIAGGTVFGRFVTLGLRRVLAGSIVKAPGTAAPAGVPKERAYPSTYRPSTYNR
jgi:hypothetical protein